MMLMLNIDECSMIIHDGFECEFWWFCLSQNLKWKMEHGYFICRLQH